MCDGMVDGGWGTEVGEQVLPLLSVHPASLNYVNGITSTIGRGTLFFARLLTMRHRPQPGLVPLVCMCILWLWIYLSAVGASLGDACTISPRTPSVECSGGMEDGMMVYDSIPRYFTKQTIYFE